MKKMRKSSFPSLRQFFNITKVLSVFEKILFFSAISVFIFSSVWSLNVVFDKYRVEVSAVGGDYVEGVLGSPQLINPLFSGLNEVDQDLVSMVYTGLMRYDKNRNLVTDLASSFEVSEDKKVYTFKIRQGVFWHDKTPFTIDDVIFTFESIQDSLVNSPLKVSFENVKIEKIDENTLKFTLNEAFPSFLSTLTVGILPKHFWSEISSDKIKLAQKNLQPIGTGPFVFKKIMKDSTGTINKIVLERFEEFYGQSAYIKTFSFIFYNDYDGPEGLVTALREKKIDGINFVPFEYLEKVKRKNIDLHTLKLPQYTALFYNMQRDFLDEKDFRFALAQAVDRNRIVNDILQNEAELINGPILEGFPGFDANLEGTKFSFEEANKLLDKNYERISAEDFKNLLIEKKVKEYEEQVKKENETTSSTDNGISTSTTTTLNIEEIKNNIKIEVENTLDEAQLFYRTIDKNDKTKILELNLVTASTPEYTKIAELIAGYYQDIGIKTKVSLVDSKEFVRSVLKTHNYDILLYGVIVGNDPDQYPFWHSKQVDYPGLNLSYYEKRSVDELLEKIRTTKEDSELNTLYSDLQKIILEDTPATFLFLPTYTYALSNFVKGFDVSNISHPADRFSNVNEWYIKTKKNWNFNK
ncbi:MAG: peptide ABC transporter substrate-binding protein [Candidatus Magasanikbacteria bacterium]